MRRLANLNRSRCLITDLLSSLQRPTETLIIWPSPRLSLRGGLLRRHSRSGSANLLGLVANFLVPRRTKDRGAQIARSGRRSSDVLVTAHSYSCHHNVQRSLAGRITDRMSDARLQFEFEPLYER